MDHPISPRPNGCAIIAREQHGRYGDHCDQPPAWRGRWRYDHPHRVVTILLCDQHRAELAGHDRLTHATRARLCSCACDGFGPERPHRTAMTGAPSGRVVFIDGYAGPGQYLDATPGSPVMAVETARRLAHIRSLECWFIEADRRHYETLCATLRSDDRYKGWDAVHGTAAEHLDTLVSKAGPTPLLVFLDPYGLTVPFNQLVSTVLSRPIRTSLYRTERPTEVVFNFSLSAVRRCAGRGSLS